MTHPSTPLVLVGSCINPLGPDRPGADKRGEYLRFRRDGAIRGFRVRQRVRHTGGHPDTFQDIYVADHEPAVHIQELVLRNGHGTRHEDQARLIDYMQSGRWVLNNKGETIQVVSPNGQVVASFDIPADTCAVLPAAPSRIIIPAAGVGMVGAFGQLR